MIEGFMKSVQNMLNVNLGQGDSSLPKYTQERDEVLKVAEENTVLEKYQNESEPNISPVTKPGFQGRIRKWFKSVLSLFKHS